MKRTRRFFGFSLAVMAGMALVVILGGNAIGQQALPPLGPLPPVPIPPDNPQTPAKVELGQLLCFDPRYPAMPAPVVRAATIPKLIF